MTACELNFFVMRTWTFADMTLNGNSWVKYRKALGICITYLLTLMVYSITDVVGYGSYKIIHHVLFCVSSHKTLNRGYKVTVSLLNPLGMASPSWY